MKYKLSSLFFLLLTSIAAHASSVNKEEASGMLQQNGNGFIENKGQMQDETGKAIPWVLFKTQVPGMDLYITEKGLTYIFIKAEKEEKETEDIHKDEGEKEIEYARVDVELKGAEIKKENIIKEFGSQENYNFYYGNNSAGVFGVKKYGRVTIKNIYPGVDWVLNSGFQNSKIPKLEYDFIVHPNANPDQIRMLYKWADVETEGKKLKIKTPVGELEEGELKIFQVLNSKIPKFQEERLEVFSKYIINENEISFAVGNYDHSRELVIDPPLALVWGTYFGGSAADGLQEICTDNSGNVYATGYNYSPNMPTLNQGGTAYFQGVKNVLADFAILKFNNSGGMIWATFLGGNVTDYSYSITTDLNSNIFVTGYTSSSVFPTLNPGGGAYFQASSGGSQDAIILKFDNAGLLVWSTFFGGSSNDNGNGITTDANGNIFVTGNTSAANFPGKNPGGGAYYQTAGAGLDEAFILKFTNAGVLLWSTRVGGSDYDKGTSVAMKPGGNVVITGYAKSTNFPTKNAGGSSYFQAANGGLYDVFVTEFNNSGVLQWSSYLGGNDNDKAFGLASDINGNIFVTGQVYSTNFPLQNPGAGAYFQSALAATEDVFVTKFSNTAQMQWSTYFGGNVGNSWGAHLATDATGNVFVTGQTAATNFPTKNPGGGTYYQGVYAGGFRDVFITEFSNNGNMQWSTFNGSIGTDFANSITTDNTGSLFVTGEWNDTLSNGVQIYPGSYSQNYSGSDDSFIMKFGAISGFSVSVSGTNSCGSSCNGTAEAFILGGISPYKYNWSNGQTSSVISGLCAGTYYVSVSDFSNTTLTSTVVISSGTSLVVSVTTISVSCNGAATGSANINVSGGSSPYSYLWSNNSSQFAVYSLQSGNYTVTVMDASGCANSQSTIINQPSAITITITASTATCGNIDGSATAIVSGGSPGYFYSWSNGSSQFTVSGLQSAVYSVTITDGNNCMKSSNVQIVNFPGVTAQIISSKNISCNGSSDGFIEAGGTGGATPYSYAWSNAATTSQISNSQSQIYSVTITDNAGCSSSTSFFISEPSALAVLSTKYDVLCNNDQSGSVITNISGGTAPYYYNWSNGATTSSIYNLTFNIYNFTVTDGNGCTASVSATIVALSTLTIVAGNDTTISSGDAAQLWAVSGTGVNYSWYPANTLSCDNCDNPVAHPAESTIYYVVATDNNGCTATDSVIVTVEVNCGELFIPNAFSPNSDGDNDSFCVHYGNNCFRLFQLIVYDRWGEKVFITADSSSCWNGTDAVSLLNNSKPEMNTALFVYYFEAILLNGEHLIKKGNVSLIR